MVLPGLLCVAIVNDYVPTVTQYDKFRLKTTSGFRYLGLMLLISGSCFNGLIYWITSPRTRTWTHDGSSSQHRKVSGHSNTTENTLVKHSSCSSSDSEKPMKKASPIKDDFWHLNPRNSVCQPIPSSFDLMDEKPSAISNLSYSRSFVRNKDKVNDMKTSLRVKSQSHIGTIKEEPEASSYKTKKNVVRASSMREMIKPPTARGYQVDIASNEAGTRHLAVRSNSFSVKQQRSVKRNELLNSITKDIRRQKQDGVSFAIPEE